MFECTRHVSCSVWNGVCILVPASVVCWDTGAVLRGVSLVSLQPPSSEKTKHDYVLQPITTDAGVQDCHSDAPYKHAWYKMGWAQNKPVKTLQCHYDSYVLQGSRHLLCKCMTVSVPCMAIYFNQWEQETGSPGGRVCRCHSSCVLAVHSSCCSPALAGGLLPHPPHSYQTPGGAGLQGYCHQPWE